MGYRCRIIRFFTCRASPWRRVTGSFCALRRRTPSSSVTGRGGFLNDPSHARCRKLNTDSLSYFCFRNSAVLRRLLLGGLLLATGCRQDMHDQPRYKPLATSTFFADGRSSRPLVPGTVARGDLRDDEYFYTGKSNGELVDKFPSPLTHEILLRGQERYNIFCSPCHDR